MNSKQALVKAKKLWGPKADVAVREKGSWDAICYGRFNINSGTWACKDGKGKVNIWGNGNTWEKAFENAKCRYKHWENKNVRL
jgi:hypothetical protein